VGWLERILIRGLEPLVDRRWIKNRLPVSTDTNLRLGNASAAFGRRGTAPVVLTPRQRLSHSASFGASGAGKTVQQLGTEIHDIETGQPFLKLELHDAVDKLLRVVARKVVSGEISEDVLNDILLISPGYGSWCVTVDPLHCPVPEFAPIKVAAFMRLIRTVWKDTLGPQTHEFAQNLLILMAERKLPLASITHLLSDKVALRTHVLGVVNGGAREYFLTRFLTWSPRRQSQVMEAFLNKVTVFLSDPRIAAMLSTSDPDINFRRIIDQKKTVLIEVSKAQFLESADLLAAMILIDLLQAVFSREDLPEERRHPFLIVIDEFPSFAGILPTTSYLNETRKYGCGVSLISQTFASLDRDVLSSIRTNCFTQLYFRLSPEDAKIAVAGLHGEARELLARELVSLPTGTAMLMLGGGSPQRIKIDNTPVPDRLSDREKEIIDRIRRNVGRPLDLSRGAPAPGPVAARVTASPAPAVAKPASASPDSTSSQSKPVVKFRRQPKTAGRETDGFVEGDV